MSTLTPPRAPQVLFSWTWAPTLEGTLAARTVSESCVPCTVSKSFGKPTTRASCYPHHSRASFLPAKQRASPMIQISYACSYKGLPNTRSCERIFPVISCTLLNHGSSQLAGTRAPRQPQPENSEENTQANSSSWTPLHTVLQAGMNWLWPLHQHLGRLSHRFCWEFSYLNNCIVKKKII